MHCSCLWMNWTLVWLAPGDSQNSEYVCFMSYFSLLVKWSKLTERNLWVSILPPNLQTGNHRVLWCFEDMTNMTITKLQGLQKLSQYLQSRADDVTVSWRSNLYLSCDMDQSQQSATYLNIKNLYSCFQQISTRWTHVYRQRYAKICLTSDPVASKYMINWYVHLSASKMDRLQLSKEVQIPSGHRIEGI